MTEDEGENGFSYWSSRSLSPSFPLSFHFSPSLSTLGDVLLNYKEAGQVVNSWLRCFLQTGLGQQERTGWVLGAGAAEAGHYSTGESMASQLIGFPTIGCCIELWCCLLLLCCSVGRVRKWSRTNGMKARFIPPREFLPLSPWLFHCGFKSDTLSQI